MDTEILNSKSIYDVFETEPEVFTNLHTLNQFMIPKEIIYELF